MSYFEGDEGVSAYNEELIEKVVKVRVPLRWDVLLNAAYAKPVNVHL